jgi:Ca2+-binding EF-hand superfamily protein
MSAPQRPTISAPDEITKSRIDRRGRVTVQQVQQKKEANKKVIPSHSSRIHLNTNKVIPSTPTISEPKTSNNDKPATETKKENRKSAGLTPNYVPHQKMNRQSSSATVSEVVIKSYWKKYSIQEGHGHRNIIEAKQLKSLCYDMGIYLEPEDVNLVLALIDTDRNGTIEFSEFLVWWRSSKKIAKLASLENENVQKSIAYFKDFDIDGNGYITGEEFYDLHVDLVKSGLIDPSLSKEAALKEIDPDNDQVITFDNFMEWMGCVDDEIFIADTRIYTS